MRSVKLTPLNKKVKIRYTQKLVQLSQKRKNEIEEFWTKINQDDLFHRGEVFNVKSLTERERSYDILLTQTDYAHYLYTVRNKILDDEGCKVIFGSGLIETKDSVFVFGEMANHTAYPGRLQCAGGGLSWEDKAGDYFDVKQSVLREINEELGLNLNEHIKQCTPVFLKSGGTYDFFSILYHIKLKITQSELMEIYGQFTEDLLRQDKFPEFQNLVCVENNEKSIMNFFER